MKLFKISELNSSKNVHLFLHLASPQICGFVDCLPLLTLQASEISKNSKLMTYIVGLANSEQEPNFVYSYSKISYFAFTKIDGNFYKNISSGNKLCQSRINFSDTCVLF